MAGSTLQTYYNLYPKPESYMNVNNALHICLSIKTGTYRVKSTLAIMGLHETGLCDECGVSENVCHVLFSCSKYNIFWDVLSHLKNGEERMKNEVILGKGLT